jgi:hypothetical protein
MRASVSQVLGAAILVSALFAVLRLAVHVPVTPANGTSAGALHLLGWSNCLPVPFVARKCSAVPSPEIERLRKYRRAMVLDAAMTLPDATTMVFIPLSDRPID